MLKHSTRLTGPDAFAAQKQNRIFCCSIYFLVVKILPAEIQHIKHRCINARCYPG